MKSRSPFLASESRALRRLADAAPGHGAFPLLGAPLLAVIVTFLLQPRASGFEPDPVAPDPTFEAGAPFVAAVAADDPATALAPIAAALDRGDYELARELLVKAPRAIDPAYLQAYQLMLECLEAPSNDTVARAYRFYLEDAPESVRDRLYAACLMSR